MILENTRIFSRSRSYDAWCFNDTKQSRCAPCSFAVFM